MNNEEYGKTTYGKALENIINANKRGQEITNQQLGYNSQVTTPQYTKETKSKKPAWWKQALGFVDELVENVSKGFMGVFEGLIDLGIGTLGEVGSWFGASTEWAEEAVKFDITNWLIDDLDIMSGPYTLITGKKNDIYNADNSFINNFSDKTQEIIQGIEQGIGTTLAAAAPGAVFGIGEAASLSIFGAGAAGQSFGQALNEGADYNKALAYGLISGATEAGIEQLSGGIGKALGIKISSIPGFDKFGKALSKMGIKELGATFLSEGLEEVASDLLNPIYKSIYNGKTIGQNFKDDVSVGSLLETFFIGGASGAIMSGASTVTSRIYYSKEGVEIRSEIAQTNEDITNAYVEFMTSKQTTAEEQVEALNKYNEAYAKAAEKYQELQGRVENLSEKYKNRVSGSLDVGVINLKTYEDANARAISEVMDKINENRDSASQINVEFVDENSEFNGKYNRENNTIYLSKNTTKALRQVLTHEISHAMENNAEYNDILQEMVDNLVEDEEFTNIKEKVREDYKDQNLSEADINNEAITEYIANNFFKSYSDLSKAFTNKTTLEKFKDMIRNLRSGSKNNSLREQYLKLFQKLNKTNVSKANSKTNTKYNVKQQVKFKSSENKKYFDSLPIKYQNKLIKISQVKYFDKMLDAVMLSHLIPSDIDLLYKMTKGNVSIDEIKASHIYQYAENYIKEHAPLDPKKNMDLVEKVAEEFEDRILSDANERNKGSNINNKEGKLLVVTGLPGSGKSSGEVINFLNNYGAIEFDNDIAKAVPCLAKFYNGGLGANTVQPIVSEAQKLVQEKLIKEKYNIVLPTVGSKYNKICKMLSLYADADYNEIDIIHVKVSSVTSINRAFKRFIESGRYVPISYIEGMKSNEENIDNETDGVYNEVVEKGVVYNGRTIHVGKINEIVNEPIKRNSPQGSKETQLSRSRYKFNRRYGETRNRVQRDGDVITSNVDELRLRDGRSNGLTEQQDKKDKFSLKSKNDIKETREFAKQTIDKFNIMVDGTGVSFVDTKGSLDKLLLKLVNNTSNFEDVRKKRSYKAFISQAADSIRIGNRTLMDYYMERILLNKEAFNMEEYREFREAVINELAYNNYSFVSEDGTEKSWYEAPFETRTEFLLKSLTNRLFETLNMYKGANIDVRKATVKLINLKYAFNEIVRDNKKLSPTKLSAIFENVATQLSKIRITGTGGFEHKTRAIIADIGAIYKENFKLNQYKKNEAFIEACIDLVTQRYQEIEASGKKKKPTIDMVTKHDLYAYDKVYQVTEAEAIINVLKDVKRMIELSKRQESITLNGKSVTVQDVAVEEIKQQQSYKRADASRHNKYVAWVNKFLREHTGILDTQAVFNVYAHGNKNTLWNDIYSDLKAGRDESYHNYSRLATPLNEWCKKNKKLAKSLLKSKVTLFGKELNIGQIIGLSLSLETDNAYSHVMANGVTLENGKSKAIDITGDDILKQILSNEEYQNYVNANKATKESIKKEVFNKFKNHVNELISSDYNEFMQIIRDMYKKSTNIYIYASDELLGYHYEPKGVYYPTKASFYEFNRQLGDVNSNTMFVDSVMNPSFSKSLTKGAKNTLKIGNVLDTAVSFMKSLSNFSGISLKIKNINKVLNARVDVAGTTRKMTILEYMNKNVDSHFSERMDRLFKAMQGINLNKSTFIGNGLRYLRKANAKYGLGANLKTAVSQFLSYPMAFSKLKLSSLMRGLGGTGNSFLTFDELLESSAYTKNRYEENNLYNAEAVGAIDRIGVVGDIFMKPIKMMDRFTLSRLWIASQSEVGFDKNESNETIREEKKKEAIAKFEEVVETTQPQYDPLNNGDLTRMEGQGSEIAKSILQFSSVVRKYLSRLYETTYNLAATEKGTEARKEAIRDFGKAYSGFFTGAIAMTMLSSLLKYLKGSYDDDEPEEIALSILKDDFATNIVGLLPFMKTLYGHLINGYDLDLINLPQLTEGIDLIFKEFPSLFDKNATNGERNATLWRMTKTVGKIAGIPVNNLYNDMLYVLGSIDKVSGRSNVIKLNNMFYNTNNNTSSKLLKIYKNKKDIDKVATIIQIKAEDSFSKPIGENGLNEIARLYTIGALDTLPKMFQSTISIDGENKSITNATRKKLKSIYNLANEQLEIMLAESSYSSLTDEEKAIAITKLYDAYYEYAKNSAYGLDSATKMVNMINYIDLPKFIPALAKTAKIKSDEKITNKKEQVASIISKQKMSKAEKYLTLFLSGYSLGDENKKLVSQYLRNNGMSTLDINKLFS